MSKKKYIGNCPKCLEKDTRLVLNKLCVSCYTIEYVRKRNKSGAHLMEKRARNMIQGRVMRGTIKRQPCKFCGLPNADAHHEDYSKPLEVIWVCRKHHGMIHRGLLSV